MDHHMERHRAHSVVVGVTCPPRDHRVEHTKLVSCEPTMAIAWSTTGLKGCVGGVWHVPSTGPPCSVWDRGRRVRACVPPRGQLTGLEGAVAMRALPRVEGWAVVCCLRRSVSLDTPKRYYMPSISDREGGWGREVEGVECSMFVARALGVIYPTPALQMLLLGDSRPGTRRTLPRGCRYAGRETNT